jgi:putative endonuclease
MSPTVTPAHAAEELVAKHLVRQGWKILFRNRRIIGSEVDLAAEKGKTLIFVEVKLRKNPFDTDISALITGRKKRSLIRGLRDWLSKNTTRAEFYRVDLAVVCREDFRISHYIPGVFEIDIE